MQSEVMPNVGSRLRNFREREGWSLRELSERCGLSINAISRIERGENSPTITSLSRLASALSVPITDFFVDTHPEKPVLVKADERRRVEMQLYDVEHLAYRHGGQLETFIMKISPNHNSDGGEVISHPGEEFLLCLRGSIEMVVGGDSFQLGPGDSLLYQGDAPHAFRNAGDREASVLVVFQAARDSSLARRKHKTG